LELEFLVFRNELSKIKIKVIPGFFFDSMILCKRKCKNYSCGKEEVKEFEKNKIFNKNFEINFPNS